MSGRPALARCQVLEVVTRRRPHARHHALVHAARDQATNAVGRHGAHGHAGGARGAPRARARVSPCPATRDVGRAPGAQRLEHRIDAVDDHGADLGAWERGLVNDLLTLEHRRPVEGGDEGGGPRAAAHDGHQCHLPAASLAACSMAGTSRSSSGPSGSPVHATRMVWKSALPFGPGRGAHLFGQGAERLLRRQGRGARRAAAARPAPPPAPRLARPRRRGPGAASAAAGSHANSRRRRSGRSLSLSIDVASGGTTQGQPRRERGRRLRRDPPRRLEIRQRERTSRSGAASFR